MTDNNNEENNSFLSEFMKEDGTFTNTRCPYCRKFIEGSESSQFILASRPKVYIKCKKCQFEGWIETE